MKNVLYSVDRGAPYYDEWILKIPPSYPSFNPSWCYTASATLTAINTNYYGWMNTCAHGEWNQSWVLEGDQFFASPRWGTPNLRQLTNQNAYFIHYSVACDQTAYDDLDYPGYPRTDTTMGEGLIEAYSAPPSLGGAVASFTTTRAGQQANLEIQQKFLNAVFQGNLWFLGSADAQSKHGAIGCPNRPIYAKYTINLFGLPLTEAWTSVPVATTTSASPNRIPVNQFSTVTVTVCNELGARISNARVTLYGCEIYRIGYTNASGKVAFTIRPTVTGTIKATATKHDYKPSQANIYVGLKSEVVSDTELPTEFFISIASSNPMKGDPKLRFGIPLEDEGFVSLKVYDVSGRVLQTAFSEDKEAGFYEVSIPTGSFPGRSLFHQA